MLCGCLAQKALWLQEAWVQLKQSKAWTFDWMNKLRIVREIEEVMADEHGFSCLMERSLDQNRLFVRAKVFGTSILFSNRLLKRKDWLWLCRFMRDSFSYMWWSLSDRKVSHRFFSVIVLLVFCSKGWGILSETLRGGCGSLLETLTLISYI